MAALPCKTYYDYDYDYDYDYFYSTRQTAKRALERVCSSCAGV